MINKHTLNRYAYMLASPKSKQISNNMSNSWVPFDTGTNMQPGYRKNAFGFVEFEGLIKSGTISGSLKIFTLPDDCVPSHNHLFAVAANGAVGRLTIGFDGNVFPTNGNNAAFSLQCMGYTTWIDGQSYPSFENSWVNYGSGWALASYFKDPHGIVHLQGLVKSGTSGQTIFTLPAGYRPEYTIILPTFTDTGFGQVRVESDGRVRHVGGGTGYFSLSGINFVDSTSQLNDEWEDLTLQNSWVNYDAGFGPPQVLQTPLGEVMTRGLIKSGTTTSGTTLYTYPTWARSVLRRYFPAVSNNVFGQLQLDSDGNLKANVVASSYVSLDSLNYFANWLS